MNLYDVTLLLSRSCRALPVGVSLRQDGLLLLDAMNALPVRDPAMDLTMSTMYTEKQLWDPMSSYSIPQLAHLMDEMLQLEVAWYMGRSLSTSVYSSLFYHNPNRLLTSPDPLVNLVLRACVLAFAKCVDLAHREMSKGHLQDGEDVWLDHFGLPVTLSDSTHDIVGLVEEAITWLRARGVLELLERLILRERILLAWDSLESSAPRSLPFLSPHSTPCTVDGDLSTASCYDAAIASNLRWYGPCPAIRMPTFDQAYNAIHHLLQILLNTTTQIFQSARSEIPMAESTFSLALGRSIAKSRIELIGFDPQFVPRNSAMDGVIDRLSTAQGARASMFRGIVENTFLGMATAPHANICRQRRKLLQLAFSWLERSIGSRFLEMRSVEISLLTIRLDCLLAASLRALELSLIPKAEQLLFWWWVAEVTQARRRVGSPRSDTAHWARAWYWISMAMLRFYASQIPSAHRITRCRFNLRFKWERKTTGAEGVLRPLRPGFSKWTNFLSTFAELEPCFDSREISGCLGLASSALLACEEPKGIIQALRLEIQASIRVKGHRWKRGIWLPIPV